MDLDRLKHSYSVAKKMQDIGRSLNLSDSVINELFVLGLNHDIGYEFSPNGVNHNKIGGRLLRSSGYKYWREVYYHGELTDEYDSLYLLILNQADMQINKYGDDVGYEGRLRDIEIRYGSNSPVFSKCYELVRYISNCSVYEKYMPRKKFVKKLLK